MGRGWGGVFVGFYSLLDHALGYRPTRNPPRKNTPTQERPLKRAIPVHPASPEPRHFPCRIQPLQRFTTLPKHPPRQIRFQPTQRLPRQNRQPDCDQRPRRRIENPVRPRHPRHLTKLLPSYACGFADPRHPRRPPGDAAGESGTRLPVHSGAAPHAVSTAISMTTLSPSRRGRTAVK